MLISLTVLTGAGLLLVALFVALGRLVGHLRDSGATRVARDLGDIIPGLLLGGLTLISLSAIFGFAWGIVVLLRGAL